MLRLYINENWKKIEFEGIKGQKYAISDFGRMIRYHDKLEDGIFVGYKQPNGYISFKSRKLSEGKLKSINFYLHRLVAEYFLEKPENKDFVVHLDHNKTNNHISNLKWADKEEVTQHNRSNPSVIDARERAIATNRKKDGVKLTSTDVIRIKKRLADPKNKTRVKIMAKQLNVSEMTIYRIKSGENWSHIKI